MLLGVLGGLEPMRGAQVLAELRVVFAGEVALPAGVSAHVGPGHCVTFAVLLLLLVFDL